MVTLHISSPININAVTDDSGNEYPYSNCDQHFNCYTITCSSNRDPYPANSYPDARTVSRSGSQPQ